VASVMLLLKYKDIKGIIRSRNSKNDRQHNGQKKKVQTTIYKILHRNIKIEQHEQTGMNSGAPEW